MDLKYRLEDRPPLGHLIIYGIQWLAVTIPAVIILGKILGKMEGNVEGEILYIQKTFAVIAITLLAQLWWGHRLPLVIGPASVLLIGILASHGTSSGAIYFCIMICGILLAIIAGTGLFASLQRLFTPRVVAVILLLVAFTMLPVILRLISGESGGISSAGHLAFALVFTLLMFISHRVLSGLWRSTLILPAMIIGSFVYYIINPSWVGTLQIKSFSIVNGFFHKFTEGLFFDPGVMTAFILCSIGLSINDLGSIQAVGSVLKANEMSKRITRGIAATGLGNALAGFLGVIGPVNFSFSPGVIASTGCAARRTMIPAGVIMLALAFSPKAIFLLSIIPEVVIGCVLLFIMCTQVAAGLVAAFASMEQPYFDNALLIGLPILTGVIVAFLPMNIIATFPAGLRPILANGFVVGVLCSLLLEHVIYRSYGRA